jgi:hypothetical protein
VGVLQICKINEYSERVGEREIRKETERGRGLRERVGKREADK